ncbi:tetratricopeptide repeat protein [Couchioplanes caeruleus]|uniref:tetratricopeptide repeat protein n=1 Tax=Couchioplanes caeruleus TaxID=56438 RepID=UPI001FD259EF|nr:tetratricopeptide repeat protein [Couchioplanes caeruleus]
MTTTPVDAFTTLPDPAQASSLADLVKRLRLLKVWAGNPSYGTIKDRINAAWTAAGRPAGELVCKSTVAYCFRPGRRRWDTDLVIAVIQALHPDTGYVALWRQALRVIGGEIEAVSRVRVQDSLPQDLDGFTGRTGELDRLRCAVQGGKAVVVSAIEGMAGVGKTRLAVHAGHLLHREQPFERVLFVDLRGFDPDPAQPPADPAAVLDGFLRLLGVPGQQIPHGLEARAAAYRGRLAGTRALVVLDNAATTEQVRPLLPATPGCLTLVTSRRRLADLHPATHLSVDAFNPDEALAFLARTVPGVPAGSDPRAADRIARRCGYLPLALGLVAGHIRNTPGWTLTDHADRLDERHHDRRLDTGIELALTLSYQHLPADQRRLLRLLALHPGQDLDAYAAAALADTDLDTARARLHHLRDDHLLEQAAPGRYTFHDLTRAYATIRATDEEPPPARRAALTRLFDHYLATSAAAMNTLHPAEALIRPRILPAGTPTPELPDPDSAREWLDTERPALVAVAVHTATRGWPAHTTLLSRVLQRYLAAGGHNADAVMVHGHGHHAARQSGDPIGQAHGLIDIGFTYGRLGRYGWAAESLQEAVNLFRHADHLAGQGRASDNLGDGDEPPGRHQMAIDRSAQALTVFRQVDDRVGEAYALEGLGLIHLELGRPGSAAGHLQRALALFLQVGDHAGETWTHEGLGLLHTRLGHPVEAAEHYHQALAICRAAGDRYGEARVLNSLGEAAHTAGRPCDALNHHTAAHAVVADTGDRPQQARALTGIGHAHRALGNRVLAREHYRYALALYTGLGRPEAYQTRAHLADVDPTATSSERQ